MAYDHTTATFLAAVDAAVDRELGAITNTLQREAIKRVVDALAAVVSAEFLVVEAG
jgi:hypothetical protein